MQRAFLQKIENFCIKFLTRGVQRDMMNHVKKYLTLF